MPDLPVCGSGADIGGYESWVTPEETHPIGGFIVDTGATAAAAGIATMVSGMAAPWEPIGESNIPQVMVGIGLSGAGHLIMSTGEAVHMLEGGDHPKNASCKPLE